MKITHTLPQIPDTQDYTVTLNTIPHTSNNTRCHHISLRHFVSNTNKPKLHESCSTKSKPYSMLQIKNFLCCVVKEVSSFICVAEKNIVLENPNRYIIFSSFIHGFSWNNLPISSVMIYFCILVIVLICFICMYNMRADDITKWQLKLLSSVVSCYIKRKNK